MIDLSLSEIDGIVWRLVLQFINRNDIRTHLNSTKEDLLAEAKVAALIAIANYDANKGVKLTTFVYDCVKNALLNLKDKESARSVVDFVEDVPEVSDCSIEERDFMMTMRSVLTRQEYALFTARFVEDQSVSSVCERFRLKRREADECYNRIMQKYLLLEQTRHQVSTTRTLQSKWLESSRD